MKILLSYSYHHFDPGKPLSEQEYRNTSAGIKARVLYELLSTMGDVTYTDGFRYKEHLGKTFDLFVGIASHFHDILRANRINIKKSVLIAVNMHPLERNAILKKAALELKLPKEAFSEKDLVDAAPYLEAIDRADFILCLGSMATYNSYIQNGVPKSKIKLYNNGHIENIKSSTEVSKPRRLVYVSSEIGLRKGFDLVYETLIKFAKYDFMLDVVGTPSTAYHQKKIDKLGRVLGKRMTYHGWISASDQKYDQILRRADFLFFPSLEEGQAGTVLDAIARGVIPIISQNVGIEFAPLGFAQITGPNRLSHNIKQLHDALRLPKKEVRDLKRRTLEYYQEYHAPFQQNLELLLRGALHGSIYPKTSLILPIFNKEATIQGLLENLDTAIGDYPNAELHIIFDGCIDKTEQIVREFYQQPRCYEVTFEATPNIFEVKTNNLGLKKSTGKYAVIIQDDNYIYDPDFLYEPINFLDKNPAAVILGGLAGTNIYPRGYTDIQGPGQIGITDDEVHWRQDERSNPQLKTRVYQVDACMRGPLILRKSFLDKHGYLDEIYAPLYQDDMDLGMRAASLGYKVYCMIMNVENKSLTMAHADPGRSKLFADIIARNSGIFYTRWKPSILKDYSWIQRIQIWQSPEEKADAQRRKRTANQPMQATQLQQEKGHRIMSPQAFTRKAFNKLARPLGIEIVRLSKPAPDIETTPPPPERPALDLAPFRWLMRMGIKTVLDIGANTGQFAKYIHQIIPAASIISFEPLKDCYKELLENTRDYKNFTAFNFALGDQTGKVPIHRSQFSPSSSMLPMGQLHKDAFPFTKETVIEDIRVKRLGDLKDLPIEYPLMVKIDVQGTEDKVIAGGKELIGTADIVLTEVSFSSLYDGQALFGGLYESLAELGFEYMGNWYQDNDTRDGAPLQADAIFMKPKHKSALQNGPGGVQK